MNLPSVIACVPSVRGSWCLPTLFSLHTQAYSPERILVLDVSGQDICDETKEPLSAWFMETFAIEVHKGAAFTPPAEARKQLAELANTSVKADYLLFVDDDVWLEPKCLKRLLKYATGDFTLPREEWKPVVGGTKINVIPQPKPYGPHSWGHMHTRKGRSHATATIDTGLFLVAVKDFLEASKIPPPNPSAGEDLFISVLLLMEEDLYICDDAVGWHMNEGTTTHWENVELNAEVLTQQLASHVKPEGIEAFLGMIGEKAR